MGLDGSERSTVMTASRSTIVRRSKALSARRVLPKARHPTGSARARATARAGACKANNNHKPSIERRTAGTERRT